MTFIFLSRIWILLVSMRITYGRTPTELFKRCTRYEGHDCLQYQNHQCIAKNIEEIDQPEYHCRDVCPTTPTNLQVQVYMERRNIGGYLYPGANVSWTVEPGQYQLRGFIVQFTSDQYIFMVYLDIPQPTDLTVYHYDCFFPIMPNRTWTVHVYSVPFDKNAARHRISDVFTLDKDGNRLYPDKKTTETAVATNPVTLTATPATSTTTETTSLTTVSTTTPRKQSQSSTITLHPVLTSGGADEDEGINSKKYSPPSSVNLPPTSINGIIIGVLSAVVLLGFSIVILCHVQPKWRKMRDRNCFQRCQRNVCKVASTDVKSNGKPEGVLSRGCSRRVLMLYLQPDRQEHISSLVTSLTDICHLNDINTLESRQSEEGMSLREKVEEEINNAELILVVSSDHLKKAVHDLTSGRCPTDSMPAVLALDILVNAHNRYRSKIITAYFPSSKDLGVLRGFSDFALVVLPRDLEALVSHIQDPDASQLVHLELPNSRYHDFDFESINGNEYTERLFSLESGFGEQPNLYRTMPLVINEVTNQCNPTPEEPAPIYKSQNSQGVVCQGCNLATPFSTHKPSFHHPISCYDSDMISEYVADINS